MLRFVVACAVAAFSVGVALAADLTPLPKDLKIVAPDGSVPPEVAGFSGKWVGRWGDELDGTLVVQKIAPPDAKGIAKAEVIYSWGTSARWRISQPGFREYDGEIQGGQLILQGGARLQIRYRLGQDRSTLEGVYNAGRGDSYGTFKKVAE